ncbi:hypothetical protein F5Y19DRAFT_218284 [Xylariaceae sp. FL1651]|nr:hypothetical protein F5Y19DRAFT_218284 [Xylariaceae sp. FL1651]
MAVTPASLLSKHSGEDRDSLYKQVSRRFGIQRDSIENILPCTPSQQDVLDCAADDGRRALGHVVYEIPEDVDLGRVAAAWREIVRQTTALRTFIFTSKSGESFQVVLAQRFFAWARLTSFDVTESIIQDEAGAAMPGPRCNRYTVLEGEGEQRLLIWTFHHALVDRVLRERTLRRVQTVYDGGKAQYLNHIGITGESQVEDASRFWQRQFDHLDASAFPTLPSHVDTPRPDMQSEHRIALPGPAQTQRTWSGTAVCRAALAVLSARSTLASEALFGVITERSQEQADGPIRTLVPMRVSCAPDRSVSDVMEAVTAYDNALHNFGQAGLCNISRSGEDGAAACGFQTILLVTTGDKPPQEPSLGLHRTAQEADHFAPFTNRALLLQCHMSDDAALLTARYDESVIDELQMSRFLKQLGCLIQQFQSHGTKLSLVGRLDLITKEDRAEIATWNSVSPQVRNGNIHSLVTSSATAVPEKIAVSAWDGDWTFAELEDVSSRLAAHIHTNTPSQSQAVVPICYEKSKWVVAGMLAVLKAGRAFTLVDPSLPRARIAQICRQTSATLALTSKLHYDTMATIVERCVVVDDETFRLLPGQEEWVPPTVKPRDLAYILFTSGSTGEPKGAMIEHQGFASRAIDCGRALSINSNTRSLQFASFAFGSFMVEIVVTLIHGGCVCIPSDHDRMNNVPEFIRRRNVNWALLTPSFIGTMDPDSVPGLRTVVSAGELMSASLRDAWTPRAQVLNAYGLSEISIICSATDISSGPRNTCRAVGARFWVVDPNELDRLAPIGCIGELVVETPGVARGYLVAPPGDSSRFISTMPAWYPSQHLPDGVKLYQTGDLVCYRSDGSVVYLGRGDSQVKIRGQRVETGEVETRLRGHLSSDMMPVVEAVKRSGSTHLIAFLIESSERAGDDAGARILDSGATTSMNEKLRQLLPQHSIPAYYIRMNRLPQTVTGKTDRRRLRSVASKLLDELVQTVRSTAPEFGLSSVTSKEAKLRELWFRGLDLDPRSDSRGASFFELGGNSIVAMKMVNMARLAGIGLRVTDIFDNPTLAGLIRAVCPNSSAYTPIPSMVHTGPVEQSFAQGRLWFLEQLRSEASSPYLLPFAVRMRGKLRIDALTTALLALEKRHETLRTTFEDQDGGGMQVVHAQFMNELKLIDVPDGGYLQLLQQEQTKPFDLASETGWRVSLLRLGEDDHVLSIVMHHIISDGWSVDILRRELGQFYRAAVRDRDLLAVVKPLPISYRDFSVWQKQETQVAEHQRQVEYWTRQLADSSPAELLTDFPRPSTLSGQAGSIPVTIEGEVYKMLLGFCRAHKATSFAVLLAAFRAAHYRLTGAEDATIGAPSANRNRLELEDMIGFFVNTQCMRITVERHDTFESMVQQVRGTVAAASEHQDVPFDRVVSAVLPGVRDTSRNPLVQLIFAVHSQQDLGKFELEGLEAEPLESPVTTRFDVEFHLFEDAGRLTGHMIFAADLFKLETAQNVVDVFHMILRQGLEQSQTPIAVLPLTDGLRSVDIERVAYPRDSSVVDLFREQAAAHPEALAVTDSSSRLTYAEVDRQSEQLADSLRRRNMPAETLVGVLAPRSCQTIVTLLGILKANLAYLPLDVRAPTARLETILSTLPGQHYLVLLGSDTAFPKFQLPGVEPVPISDILENSDMNSLNGQAGAPAGPSATSLAHVIFTSGSTGSPKGVMVEHRNIVRLVRDNAAIPVPKLLPAPKVAHLSNIAFDAATWEIYTALLNGGTLVCIDYMTALDSKALGAVFEREQVHAALLTPALLKQCLADNPDMLARLDILVSGGDRLDVPDAIAAQALVRTAVYNAYGPTENGVMSSVYKVDINDSLVNGVPIGQAVSNSSAYIMDPHQQVVSDGVMGELVVTGDGLARGYTDPVLDVDRFVQVAINGRPCPGLDAAPGQLVRAYRTGDRARYRASDGQIEFFGRLDQQIKIRGHRIEPAEIERAILENESVRHAVVVVRDQADKGPELVGFIVHRDFEQSRGNQLISQVLEQLRVSLPSYMIPTNMVLVDRIPLNANGKVDRKALIQRAQSMPQPEPVPSRAPAAPLDEMETMVCRVFSDVLGVNVGLNDNFFTLGGHSLLATKLAARLSRQLDARVSVRDIFDHPIPGRLANKLKLTNSETYCDATKRTRTTLDNDATFQLLGLQEDPHAFIKREIYPQLEEHPWAGDILDVYPATRLQKRYLHYPLTRKPWPLAPFHIDFPPESDLARLTGACKSLVEYFDIFRTIFLSSTADELYQVVLTHFDMPVEIVQVEEDDIDVATNNFLKRDSQPVTLVQPLLRMSILVKHGSPLRVMLQMNHVCYDALSLEHMLQTLHTLYNGEKPMAPHRFAQYMHHMAESRQDGYEFWRSVLQTSSMTVMKDVRRSSSSAGQPIIGTYRVLRTIHVPRHAGADSGITQATVFTAACAFMLSRETGSTDITFGRLVSGRQGLPLNCQTLVGPCTNQIPVRVQLDRASSPREMLAQVQDQYISSIPFETLGFDEIKDHCTSWPASVTNYSCNVAYQSFDARPESRMHGQRVRMGVLPQRENLVEQGLIHDVNIIGDVDTEGSQLHIMMFVSRRVCEDQGRAERMVDELCGRIGSLNTALASPPQTSSTIPFPADSRKSRTNCLKGVLRYDQEHTNDGSTVTLGSSSSVSTSHTRLLPSGFLNNNG